MTAVKPRILVADDQPDNLLVLEEMLEERYNVRTVSDGSQLLDEVSRWGAPDLILLDVVMPEMNGFDACRHLKADPLTRDIPVIFLSGLDDPADEEFALSLGADDFIHKPFIAAVVLARVRNLLTRKEAVARERQIAVMESQLAEQRNSSLLQQQMIDRLSEMNSELERFAYVAAHDLREPCRTVVNYAQLLQKLYPDALDATGKGYLDNVIRSGRRMYDLLGGLLDFSRSTANLGTQGEVSSAEALVLALEGVADLRQQTGAEIKSGDMPLVIGDRMALVQIFQHLLSNAVKFHQPGEPPRVDVSAVRDDGFWRFCVADNGIGFDPDMQDPFALFCRLHHAGEGGAVAAQNVSVGVGLSVCKRLVRAMGGRIWADSTPGHGSFFFFTLKAA
ncbi:MAG TPA: response regulator [Candidatus Sulfotelmatobacter sp.]|jgi:signal transduction histidine kinase|nr:response regulator [Candidatus Sulfotelmatobacter sp.]